MGVLLETVFSVRSVQSGYKEEFSYEFPSSPSEQLVKSSALRRGLSGDGNERVGGCGRELDLEFRSGSWQSADEL
jgi:hypothetical protein